MLADSARASRFGNHTFHLQRTCISPGAFGGISQRQRLATFLLIELAMNEEMQVWLVVMGFGFIILGFLLVFIAFPLNLGRNIRESFYFLSLGLLIGYLGFCAIAQEFGRTDWIRTEIIFGLLGFFIGGVLIGQIHRRLRNKPTPSEDAHR
jgi:hypothetical protein